MKKGIRHFALETKELGTFDVVEYKEYQELQKRIDNAIDYIEDNSTNTYLLKSFDIDMLLEILKGSEK